MIRFRCGCQNWLEVPSSEAGSVLQCQKCGRLRSIPEIDELAAIDDDGTVRLSEAPWSERAANGGSELPSDSVQAVRPRFDPETGELIEAIELQEATAKEAPPPAPAVGRPTTLSYARPSTPVPSGRGVNFLPTPAASELCGATAPFFPGHQPEPSLLQGNGPGTLNYAGKHDYGRFLRREESIPLEIRPVHWYNIPLELFQPANILVLGIVFALHLVLQLVGVFVAAGAFPFWLVAGVLALVIFAHYVNVIDETGPERRDEMPGVLRDLSFGDDFARPLLALLTSLLLCFMPAAVLWRAMQEGRVPDDAAGAGLVAAMGLLGFALFPAVLLTAATAGTAWNLAPHRLLGVILVAPHKYLLALALLAMAVASYAVALSAVYILTVAPAAFWPGGPPINLYLAAIIGYPMLFTAIYFTHAFGWELGRMHQENHEQFPWVLQRHVSTRSDQVKRMELQKTQALRGDTGRPVRSQLAGTADRP